MNWRDLKTSFIFFAVIFHQICKFESNDLGNKFIHGIRFRSVKCTSDNITILVKYCYLKAVSRKIVTLNLGLKYLVPYTKPLYVKSIFYYRYGTIFREILKVESETCSAYEEALTNPLSKVLMDMLKSRAPHLIQPCPYNGDWDLTNFTMDLNLVDKASMIFPEGIYRIDLSLNFNGSITYNFTGSAEIKSPLKESFG
jgi:hypothetical protein